MCFMITHCTLKNNTLSIPSSKYKRELPKSCYDNRGRYFKFPSNIKSPAALEDFSHIEENTDT